MTRFVPHDIDYKFLRKIDTALSRLIYASALTSVITLIFDLTNLLPEYNAFFQITLNSINSIFAIFYFLLDMGFNYFFQASEAVRRKDFIDNSLGTKLSEQNSKGYYSNELNPAGIIKMGLNCFENSLFSKTNSGMMLKKSVVQTLIVIGLFLCIALFTNNKTLSTVLQLALPLTIIQQTIKLYFFNKKMEIVYEDFHIIFSATNDANQQNLIIRNVINYETTLSWGSILLDEDNFNKINPSLSKRWEETKSRLNLH